MSKKVSLSVLIFTVLVAILISFMGAYAVSSSMYRQSLVEIQQAYAKTDDSKLDKILELLSTSALYEIGDDADFTGLIDWFINETGDKYAHYYSAEDFAAMNAENEGKTVGIGVMVIENSDEKAIEITGIMPDSPALEAGIQPGDLIIAVGAGESRVPVSDLGFEGALKQLKGEEGTTAVFTVRRDGEEKAYSLVRREVEALSVIYHVNTVNPKVGVVRLTQFDLTTPGQFAAAMDDLISQGCEYFIFDVRYNGGGDLASITAVLSYILNEGDVVIRTSGRDASQMYSSKVGVVNYPADSAYSACNVSKEDISKYRRAVYGKCVVLANGSTASAAELFTAALKDYEIAKVVGTVTFGKGTMQSIYDLSAFGYDGGLKMTTRMYYPPISEGYNGVGIIPDVEVELDESLANKNIYKITDAEDNQMMTALGELGVG